jgi:predicted transposase YbfD/YdcC
MSGPPIALTHHFATLPDPRVQGRTRHRLLDIVTIALCAVLCGADDWQQIAVFGQRRQPWLETFLALPGGIPSHDTFERVFACLDPQAFGACFRRWVSALSTRLGLRHVAIDGKTLRSSGGGKSGLGPLHLVSAWASDHFLSLGQVACAEKSNEITAIPQLLELLDLSGALVSIDAMGCQKDIARKVIAAGGDYVLTVKGNQPHLLEDIQACFEKALDSDFAGLVFDEWETTDQGHGRQERRSYTVIHNPEGIRGQDEWEQLQVIGMCRSERTIKGQALGEQRYFIGNRLANAQTYGEALRGHWGIENNLHWQLDVSFGEDANRVSQRQGAENLALVRRWALMLLKRHPDKGSIACKRLAAACDTQFLEELLQRDQKIGNL